MKRKPFHPMPRLLDSPSADGAHEQRAVALIRGSHWDGELDDSQLERIAGNLRANPRLGHAPSLGFRMVVATILLLASVATVMAYQAAHGNGWLARMARPEASQQRQTLENDRPMASATPMDADSRPAEAAAVQPSEPDDGLAGEREHPRRPPRISHRDTASVTPAPATAASEEIVALDQAIGLLRRQHDPGAALVALDNYLDRFPGGFLSREARFARVDALLKLDRSNEALAALEDLPLDTHGRSIELQVIRGELRSRSECVRAEQDFSAVLTHGANLALVERALYGRGACRIKRGDKTGSIQDLRDYLDRFPAGTHAVWARQWLDSANRSLANDGQVGRGPGH